MPDALWMNCPASGGAPQYTAAELRQNMALGGAWGGRSLGARQGVRPGGTQWDVTLSGSTITVWAGVGIVDPGLSTAQGPYWVALPADETATLTPAHATSPRKDVMVIRVYDTDEDGSGLRLARSEYLTGVAAPSPTEPAIPAGALRIAGIDVPASGGGSPVVTMAAPYTVAPGGVLPVRSAAEQAAVVPFKGMGIYRLDNNRLSFHDGTIWRVAGTFSDDAVVTTTQSSTTTGSYQNLATVGPQVTMNLDVGQAVEILYWVQTNHSLANFRTFAAVEITGASGTFPATDADAAIRSVPTVGSEETVSGYRSFTPTAAGAHTFTLKYKVGSGVGTWMNRKLLVRLGLV